MMNLIDVARIEEARLASATSEIADESRPVGGGLACRSAPGGWVNQAVNVGMNGPVERGELADVAAWYEGAGIEPRFELCPYADASVVGGLGELGFVARLFESVFFLALDAGGSFEGARERPRGLEIREVDKGDERAVRALVETVVPPFYPEGSSPSESDFEIAMRAVRHPRNIPLAAWMDAKVVGGGGMEVGAESAALYGVAVAKEYRRRGIQQALIAERLRIARERGAKLATISARPAAEPSPTERNARRMGFQVGYTKVILVRPGEGLVPAMG